ncbi:MAG: nuclear transport factor 2 family protein [Actinomycetota bacterium]
MERVERLLAYAEIRQLASAYAVHTDAKDIDALVALYVPDVRISSSLGGRGALAALMRTALRGVGVTFLNVGTHHIDLADDGDRATGVVYCKAEIQDGGPNSSRWIHHAIQYHDVYERRDGRWLFGANRKHYLVYGVDAGPSPLDQPDAEWPARQVGRGSHPHATATWQAFFAETETLE